MNVVHKQAGPESAGSAALKPGSLGAIRDDLFGGMGDATESHPAGVGSEALVRAVSHPEAARRMLAVEVISRFSKERAAPLLTVLLADPDPAVRRAAVSAVERLGASRTLSCWMVALDDPDPSVRRACRRALEVLTKRQVDLADLHEPAHKSRLLAELKACWKRMRLAELTAEAAARRGI